MAAVPSHAADALTERGARGPEVWPSLAIGVIWLVVLVDGLFGPDIVVSNAGSFTRIPSAIILAFFAWLATSVIARHCFGRRSSQSSQSTPVDDR